MPTLLELLEQARGTTHHFDVACDALTAAVPALGDEAGASQHGHVFLHGGKRHVVASGKLAHRGVRVQDT